MPRNRKTSLPAERSVESVSNRLLKIDTPQSLLLHRILWLPPEVEGLVEAGSAVTSQWVGEIDSANSAEPSRLYLKRVLGFGKKVTSLTTIRVVMANIPARKLKTADEFPLESLVFPTSNGGAVHFDEGTQAARAALSDKGDGEIRVPSHELVNRIINGVLTGILTPFTEQSGFDPSTVAIARERQ